MLQRKISLISGTVSGYGLVLLGSACHEPESSNLDAQLTTLCTPACCSGMAWLYDATLRLRISGLLLLLIGMTNFPHSLAHDRLSLACNPWIHLKACLAQAASQDLDE